MLRDDRDSNSTLDMDDVQELKITQLQGVNDSVSFCKFYSKMSAMEIFLLIGGSFSALIAGFILPSVSLIMGTVATAFSNSDSSLTIDTVNDLSQYVIMIAVTVFVFSYIFYAFF